MTIYLGTDHAGFELKEKVKDFLVREGYKVEDCGAYEFDKDDDYPDFIGKAAQKVSRSPDEDRGIIFGGSGQGEAMVANKYKNIRAAVFYGNLDMVTPTRVHNNANILSVGSRFLSEDEALQAVKLWLETSFNKDPRHVRRIEKIKVIENQQ